MVVALAAVEVALVAVEVVLADEVVDHLAVVTMVEEASEVAVVVEVSALEEVEEVVLEEASEVVLEEVPEAVGADEVAEAASELVKRSSLSLIVTKVRAICVLSLYPNFTACFS